MSNLSLVLMAGFYIVAGLNHFRAPQFYRPMMPPYMPRHNLLIFVSGLAEVCLGLLLFFPQTQRLAAWGIIALLVAVFPAHLYMFQAGTKVFPRIPRWVVLARMPLQGLLMLWAYCYT